MEVVDIFMDIEGVDAPQKKSIEVATSMIDFEIKASQWVAVHLLMKGCPDWLVSYANLSQKRQSTAFFKWSSSKKATYFLELAKIVAACTPGNKLDAILELDFQNSGDHNSLEVLSGKILRSMSEYKPTERKEFTHNGRTFVVPEKESEKVGNYEQEIYGKKLKVGEVIEALHRAHVFGAQDEDGNDLLPDKRLHTDLAMVSCVCREVIDGVEEIPPWGLSNFSELVTQRMKDLENLPAAIMVDVSFFLLNSQLRFFRMGLSAMHSNRRNTKVMPSKLRRKWRSKTK